MAFGDGFKLEKAGIFLDQSWLWSIFSHIFV